MADKYYSFMASEELQKIIAAEVAEVERQAPGLCPTVSGVIRNLIVRGASATAKPAMKKVSKATKD